MTVYLLKPLHWNPDGYTSPAGHRATSGYPSDYGFGHEEWNGAAQMRFQQDGVWFRAFYTNSVGDAALDSPGATTLFMYSSHDGVQELVGIASRATDISGPNSDSLRAEIRRLTGMNDLWRDAWALPLVRRLFANDERAFRRHWQANIDFGPRWMCPESHFLWLPASVDIDASQITGKSKLNTRFTSYSRIEARDADQLLRLVPDAQRTAAWWNIQSDLAQEPDAVIDDIADINSNPGLPETTKKALIDARLGQGTYRTKLLKLWEGRCAVTGCNLPEVLRASHIKAWRDCGKRDRLNPENGLPLVANLDALFDRHLITFEADGTMLVAKSVPSDERRLLGLKGKLRSPLTKGQQRYMAGHRERSMAKHGF